MSDFSKSNVSKLSQLLFTNIKLLGFDCEMMERRLNISFSESSVLSQPSFQHILYFLFEILNPELCHTEFRDCWPVLDKSHEQSFRLTCKKILSQVKKDQTSCLPIINSALFLSPYGEKIYYLLVMFSSYVLKTKSENIRLHTKMKKYHFDLHNKLIMSSVSNKKSETKFELNACRNVLKSAIILNRKTFHEQAIRNITKQKNWSDFSVELVKTYRSLNKSIKEINKQINECHEKLYNSTKHKKTFNYENSNLDSLSAHRVNNIKTVRTLWKQLENDLNSLSCHRLILESILDENCGAYAINADDLAIHVPDVLLSRCTNQLKNIDNIYQNGDLNLDSLTQLSTISLELIFNSFQQNMIPDLNTDTDWLREQLHKNQLSLQKMKDINSQIEESIIPDMESKLSELRQEFDFSHQTCFSANSEHKSPKNIDVNLVPPTPPFQTSLSLSPSQHHHVLLKNFSLKNESHSTLPANLFITSPVIENPSPIRSPSFSDTKTKTVSAFPNLSRSVSPKDKVKCSGTSFFSPLVNLHSLRDITAENSPEPDNLDNYNPDILDSSEIESFDEWNSSLSQGILTFSPNLAKN